ncbi:MAG: hypothetical protein ACYTG0_46470, partial [Planctomycetota bacterium]
MIERIQQLEKQSRVLDPDAGARAQMLKKVVRYTETFLEALPLAPVYCTSDDEAAGFLDSA